MITIEDVMDVCVRLNVELTDDEKLMVLGLYDDITSDDHWTIIIEDLIYQTLEERN